MTHDARELVSSRSAKTAGRKHSPSNPVTPGLQAFVVDGTDLIFTLTCAECGQPILDMDDANIVVSGAPDELGPARMVGASHVVQAVGGTVVARHKTHDLRREKPWVPMSAVLRGDQRTRRSIEMEAPEGTYGIDEYAN